MLHAGWQEAAAVHRRRRGCTTSGSALPTVICSGASTARLARPRPKSCIATGGERISAGRTALLPCSASEAERANSAITRGNPQLNQERKRTLPSSLILRRLSSAAPLASATRCPGAVRWKCPAPVPGATPLQTSRQALSRRVEKSTLDSVDVAGRERG